MVEYLYDAIRASSGQENIISAYITDENENLITENCYFVLHDGAGIEVIAKILGSYDSELTVWSFVINPEITKGLRGRYMYCVQHDDSSLCFNQPIYFL